MTKRLIVFAPLALLVGVLVVGAGRVGAAGRWW
jgi:hypothetical protein